MSDFHFYQHHPGDISIPACLRVSIDVADDDVLLLNLVLILQSVSKFILRYCLHIHKDAYMKYFYYHVV